MLELVHISKISAPPRQLVTHAVPSSLIQLMAQAPACPLIQLMIRAPSRSLNQLMILTPARPLIQVMTQAHPRATSASSRLMAIHAQVGDSLRYPVTNHKTLLSIIHLFNNAVHRIYREHNQNVQKKHQMCKF